MYLTIKPLFHCVMDVMSHPDSGASMLHILQRHRDILQDYSHEFQKTKSNIEALREREELLGSVKKDIDAFNKQGQF